MANDVELPMPDTLLRTNPSRLAREAREAAKLADDDDPSRLCGLCVRNSPSRLAREAAKPQSWLLVMILRVFASLRENKPFPIGTRSPRRISIAYRYPSCNSLRYAGVA
jgi:hypothetical protein